jgi:hypothetical protein
MSALGLQVRKGKAASSADSELALATVFLNAEARSK